MRMQFRDLIMITCVVVTFLLSLMAQQVVIGQGDGEVVEFTGTVESVSGTTAVISGQLVDASAPQLFALLQPGQQVNVRGTLQPGGRIMATQIVILTGAVVTATFTPGPPPTATPGPAIVYECPHNVPYWRMNRASWPVDTLLLGSQSYTRGELESLLMSDEQGDASISLARHLIAAKLNIARGTNAEAASSIIFQADTLLSRFDVKLPYNLDPASPVGEAMVTYARALSSYNRNLLTPDCRESVDDPSGGDDSEPDDLLADIVVIEGPVQGIEDDVITVYGIKIVVNPDDDIWDDLGIGDVVRVEGYFQSDSDQLILVARDIEFATGDVIVDDDDDDEGRGGDENCDNPPPAHAEARGWRHRCEGAPHPGNANGNGNGNGRGNGNGNGNGRGNGNGNGNGNGRGNGND